MRKPNPEAVFLARRIAKRNRLEARGMSAELADQWLTAWEAEARQRGLDPRAARLSGLVGSPDSKRGVEMFRRVSRRVAVVVAVLLALVLLAGLVTLVFSGGRTGPILLCPDGVTRMRCPPQ
jgi:hypothetical protein